MRGRSIVVGPLGLAALFGAGLRCPPVHACHMRADGPTVVTAGGALIAARDEPQGFDRLITHFPDDRARPWRQVRDKD